MMSPLTFIISLWVSTASTVLVILTLYRVEDKPDGLSFFGHFDGKLFIAGMIVLLCSSVLAIWHAVRLRRTGKHPLRIMLKLNTLPMIFTCTILEIFLRLLATETPMGTMLWGKPLAPHSIKIFTNYPLLEPLLSYDQTLGWIVKPNSSTNDGLYITREKGIRISKASSGFGAWDATCRIALVGDSHTYGYGLKFEETWGYLLQDYMPECQVLNFGVSGYSVGQMYLRYLRDVLPFHPNIVILALSSHSTSRTMGVYGFTMFSPGMPWGAQPRFQYLNDGLAPINLPLPRLEDIVQAEWIRDLPYIDYDWLFSPGKWELQKWQYFYNSYLFRLYITRYSLSRRQQKGDSAEILNHALLRGFIQAAESHSSIPVLLYLPDKADQKSSATDTPSLKALRSFEFEYLDLRPCLSHIPAEDRFISEVDHYSIRSSYAIAACVGTRVSSLLIPVKQKSPEYSSPR